ncbi:DUF5685 family protein [Nonomuraea sp. NPDC050556]|uniref:DUF5685 family protein n=1 Tax=Nonomuraea sp. NPDC050556 TaxID=3364369 RepID=UPI0037988170
MFGIVRPCRHGMCSGLFKEWMAHLCGLCLTLRDEHGHAARLVTNYDGLIVSVLVEAQSVAAAPRRRASACLLRGLKGADVVQAEGARLAASVSLILAAAKVGDHVADRDGMYGRPLVGAAAGWVAARWARAGSRTAAAVGFDPGALTGAVARQSRLESTPGVGLLDLTAPTEAAVSAAFAHTAVLAGRPANRAPLEEIGRLFGRLAHLLDAVEDLSDDRASGRYNPLDATGTDLATARRHCDDALLGVRLAVAELELERRRLVEALLVRELSQSVTRTFATTPSTDPSADPDEETPRQDPGPGGLLGLTCAAATCCTCGLYRAPWDEEREKGCLGRCDCPGCDGCDGCDGCCDCCPDGCDCGCDC